MRREERGLVRVARTPAAQRLSKPQGQNLDLPDAISVLKLEGRRAMVLNLELVLEFEKRILVVSLNLRIMMEFFFEILPAQTVRVSGVLDQEHRAGAEKSPERLRQVLDRRSVHHLVRSLTPGPGLHGGARKEKQDHQRRADRPGRMRSVNTTPPKSVAHSIAFPEDPRQTFLHSFRPISGGIPMGSTEDEVYCRNCSELLFRIARHDDGTTRMKNPAVEPESDGAQKYFRCPTCRRKNLVMLIEDPPGSRYYKIVALIPS